MLFCTSMQNGLSLRRCPMKLAAQGFTKSQQMSNQSCLPASSRMRASAVCTEWCGTLSSHPGAWANVSLTADVLPATEDPASVALTSLVGWCRTAAPHVRSLLLQVPENAAVRCCHSCCPVFRCSATLRPSEAC